jgi:MFS family permease
MASQTVTIEIAATAERGVWPVILASAAGTMLEWYDFFIFGSLIAVLSVKFYPPGNDIFAYVAYLATFAVGFVVRPFGSLFFRRIADVVGRKYAFLATLSIMGGATALIGLLPTFKTAGWFAPITLILIRVLQGLAVGGEYGGAAVYVAEHVPDRKRGFYTSFIQITGMLGLCVSLVVVRLAEQSMSKRAFDVWGWRLPFLLAIFLVGISLYVRSKMKESPIFSMLKNAGRKRETSTRFRFSLLAKVWRNGGVWRCGVHGATLSAILLADNFEGKRENDNFCGCNSDTAGAALRNSVRLAI